MAGWALMAACSLRPLTTMPVGAREVRRGGEGLYGRPLVWGDCVARSFVNRVIGGFFCANRRFATIH